jgi:hypothetical protein
VRYQRTEEGSDVTGFGFAARVLRIAVALVMIGGAGAAPVAADQPSGPNLTGETFFAESRPDEFDRPGDVVVTSARCTEQSAEVAYTATGIAEGPFPGPYEERVRIIAGPPDATAHRQVRATTVEFEIHSASGEVRGHKTLLHEGLKVFVCGNVNILAGFAIVELRYHATIHGSTGTYTDSGLANVQFQQVDLGVVLASNYEAFTSCEDAPERC